MTAREPPELPADSTLIRAGLRREKLAARAALTAAERVALNLAVETHLAARLLERPASSIGFCAPVKQEFDARPLVARLLAAGWQACMPVVVEAAAPMVFRPWSPDAAMATDRHGIPIPATTARVEPPQVLLLPLVAFDADGFRLGYGGGYFDRTLALCLPRPLAVGVGWELGRVASVYPQEHDQRCDAIVTEAGWWSRHGGAGNP